MLGMGRGMDSLEECQRMLHMHGSKVVPGVASQGRGLRGFTAERIICEWMKLKHVLCKQ